MKESIRIESVYNLYVDDMFTYALYLGFDKEDIKEAIQDVFCKFTKKNEQFHQADNLKHYLFKSLKNRLLDIYKTKRHYLGLPENDYADLSFNINVTIEDDLISKENKLQIESQITEMLNSLTDRQREIVYLRYVQECDYEQISQLMKITVHGCRKLLSKAMQSLREKYSSASILFLFL